MSVQVNKMNREIPTFDCDVCPWVVSALDHHTPVFFALVFCGQSLVKDQFSSKRYSSHIHTCYFVVLACQSSDGSPTSKACSLSISSNWNSGERWLSSLLLYRCVVKLLLGESVIGRSLSWEARCSSKFTPTQNTVYSGHKHCLLKWIVARFNRLWPSP